MNTIDRFPPLPNNQRPKKTIYIGIGVVLLLVLVSIYIFKRGGYSSEVLTSNDKNLAQEAVIPDVIHVPTKEEVVTDQTEGLVLKNTFIVVLKDTVSEPDKTIKAFANKYNGEIIGNVSGMKIYQVRIPNSGEGEAIRTFINKIVSENATEIEAITPDRIINTKQSTDEYNKGSWYIKSSGLDKALEKSKGGSSAVKLGILDTGFDISHSYLSGKVSNNYSYNSKIADIREALLGNDPHGNYVAGIAGGKDLRSSEGITGSCFNCMLAVFDTRGNTASVAQGLKKLIDSGARVINMSFETYQPYICTGNSKNPIIKACQDNNKQTAQEENALYISAMKYAQSQGKDVLFVVAAGNENIDVAYESPASLGLSSIADNVMVVGSYDFDHSKTADSNFGSGVNIYAPSGRIKSAGYNNKYIIMGGTSASAPMVTGVVGLAWSIEPTLSTSSIKQCLVGSSSESVKDFTTPKVNALATIDCIKLKVDSKKVSEKKGLLCSDTNPELKENVDGHHYQHSMQTADPNLTYDYDQNGFIRFFIDTTGSNFAVDQAGDIRLFYIFFNTNDCINIHTPGLQNAKPDNLIGSSAAELTYAPRGKYILQAYEFAKSSNYEGTNQGDHISYGLFKDGKQIHFKTVSESYPDHIEFSADKASVVTQVFLNYNVHRNHEAAIDYYKGNVVPWRGTPVPGVGIKINLPKEYQ